jgi:predicted nucleotide-binding protein
MMPHLLEAVRAGLDASTAVLALLTPDDVAHLHPDLHESAKPTADTAAGTQARPNVLLELGMALAAKPDATLALLAGRHRLPSDLAGLNYVRLTADPKCREKIAGRLLAAGCPVNMTGEDWKHAGDFAGVVARDRLPPAGPRPRSHP